MRPIRVGAVGYLNARPLVWGLEDRSDRFSVRYDVPSVCAQLLQQRAIEVGLVPSIEFLAQPDYRIVPDLAVASNGAVASVALFSAKPVSAVRSIALDSSSRTSAALLRILCRRRFGIDPRFITVPPDLNEMLRQCDAAMLIGDIALFVDHEAAGLVKIDLGHEWTAMTGLPFVWAFWVGRAGTLTPGDVAILREVRDAGEAASDTIAREYFEAEPAKIDRAARYLRENIQFRLGERQEAGVRAFFEAATDLGIVNGTPTPRFFEA